jgi:transposase
MFKRFVATKTPEQQSCLTLHRTRHLFIRQQTSVINAIRAHFAEVGIVAMFMLTRTANQ